MGKNDNVAVKGRPKRQRCVLWFEFSGRPLNGLTKSARSTTERRKHSVRIDQQPLGGATAIVFAADLHIGGTSKFQTFNRLCLKRVQRVQFMLVGVESLNKNSLAGFKLIRIS